MSWLSSIKLTILQFISLASAITVGVLILLLRSKNSQVHALKVDLLKKSMDAEAAKAGEASDAAVQRYKDAVARYKAITKRGE